MGFLDRFRNSKKEEDEFKFTNNLENDILFNKATEYLQEQKNEEAIKLFNKLLEKEPDNIHAINGKGSGLMQSGRLEEALEVFNQSLRIKDSEMAYLNMAIIYSNFDDYDNALKYCDKVIELYPQMKDLAQSIKNNVIEKMNKNQKSNSDKFNSEATELIEKANKLKNTNEKWEGDELHQKIQSELPEFKRVTVWDAWELYEEAIKKDPNCENTVTSYINELKSNLLQEFLFFDISKKEDFTPDREIDRLKLIVMKDILLDHEYTSALVVTKQILTVIDEKDLDAINFKGALSFYFDEIDEAIECFEKVAENGNGIYKFYGDYNKAFVLRRKSMLTGDLGYMVEAMDIYDEMLKDPQCYSKVKPYQREILDKIQDFMKVPLF